MKTISLAVLDYRDSLQTAVHGLREGCALANRACDEEGFDCRFDVIVAGESSFPARRFDAVIIPPSAGDTYYLDPAPCTLDWLRDQREQGALLAAACAGVFILAASGLAQGQTVTTHWGLADLLREHYPDLRQDVDRMLVWEDPVLTAGGMMAWVDLLLELVAHFTRPGVMRLLGKMLVVDTGPREQRYYRQFRPRFDHGDKDIATVQRELHDSFSQAVTIRGLASRVHLTERTFLRRFLRATGIKPNQYLQSLRIQRACELLETSTQSFESIAYAVGYEDANACRKRFIHKTGLTPGAFRRRFGSGGSAG